MIYLALPVGSAHGWGVCGKYVTRELANMTSNAAPDGNSGTGVRLITDQLTPESVGDELEYIAIAPLLIKADDVRAAAVSNGVTQLNGPLLSSIVDKQMQPLFATFRGTRTVGYTFFEENILLPAWMDNARRNFDLVATGSSWCTELLRQAGLANVETVIQGVDPRIFFPSPEPFAQQREFMRDRFVVFSGGKFEYRKSQDVVIRAFKVLQDRHRDVILVNSWFNLWQQSMNTMAASKHIRLPSVSGNYAQVMNQILAHNGIDVARVVTLGPRANALMPRIYHNTDMGIFPNRCEGGTNLVLMEYMACGKPVAATATTGHADVVTPDHALVISSPTENTVPGPTGPMARWPEPDLEQAVEHLEWGYQNRNQLRELGNRAAAAMAARTWAQAASGFLRLLSAT